MNKDKKIDASRRAFLTGHWRNKTEISSDCLNKQGIYCQSCKDVCREDAIIFNQVQRGVQLPLIVADKCLSCRDCVECCPVDAITISENKVA